jgi:hypothetical protein
VLEVKVAEVCGEGFGLGFEIMEEITSEGLGLGAGFDADEDDEGVGS